MQTPVNNPPAPESFAIVYLDPDGICFEYQGENLTLNTADGKFYPRVTLRRSFPLSSKRTHIIVRVPESEDQQEYEMGIIENVEALDSGSQEAIQRELQLHYFVPTIQRINTIREEFGFLYWQVDTDRGAKEFVMRDSIIGSVRQVSPKRWLVIDINQTRYEVRDFDALDERSQDMLRRYLLL
jgi:hypothetical protein